MYTLEKAYRRLDRRSGRWEEFSAGGEKILTMQARNGEVRMVVSTPGADGPVLHSFAWDALAPSLTYLPNTDLTVIQWLLVNNNQSLPLDAALFNPTPNYVQYMQAWHAGYDIQPSNRAGTRSSGADIPDLRISRSDVEPTYLGQYALASVNGLFHRMDGGVNGTFIRGGMTSINKAGDNQIGLHSFTRVGRLTSIPITAEMITTTPNETSLSTAFYVSVPEQYDVSGKIALMVLGGYLHVNDGAYIPLSERLFKLDVQNIRLLERYYESKDLIDLSSLGITSYPSLQNSGLLSLAEFWTDATILKYLTLEQSFIVLVETESLFHELTPIDPQFPGTYIEGAPSFLPLIGVNGRGVEYSLQRQDICTLMAAVPNIRYNYEFQERDYLMNNVVDAKLQIECPARSDTAYYRKMGTER